MAAGKGASPSARGERRARGLFGALAGGAAPGSPGSVQPSEGSAPKGSVGGRAGRQTDRQTWSVPLLLIAVAISLTGTESRCLHTSEIGRKQFKAGGY